MNMKKSYANWRAYRNTVAELNMLSNRELSDLGLAHGDIKFVARQAVASM